MLLAAEPLVRKCFFFQAAIAPLVLNIITLKNSGLYLITYTIK